MQIFEDMNGEEFENSSPELKHIYITYGLEERRNKYYEKVGYIHIELLFFKVMIRLERKNGNGCN